MVLFPLTAQLWHVSSWIAAPDFGVCCEGFSSVHECDTPSCSSCIIGYLHGHNFDSLVV